jgi:hypothetical protein
MLERLRQPLVRWTRKIGSCATCMRHSLQAAIATWAIFALAVACDSGAPLRVAILVLASALSVLWLIHVATYAARSFRKLRGTAEQAGGKVFPNVLPAEFERRGALGFLLRAAAVGAVSSLPVILQPSAAVAFCGQCSKDADCGVSPCYCTNTAGPGLPVCNECKC